MAIGIEKHSGHNLETTALVIKKNYTEKNTHKHTLFLLGRNPRLLGNIHRHSLTQTKNPHLKQWFIPKSSSRQQWATPPGTSRYNNLVPSLSKRKKLRNTMQTQILFSFPFAWKNPPILHAQNSPHANETTAKKRKQTNSECTHSLKHTHAEMKEPRTH